MYKVGHQLTEAWYPGAQKERKGKERDREAEGRKGGEGGREGKRKTVLK
jgi:hypothetical protein